MVTGCADVRRYMTMDPDVRLVNVFIEAGNVNRRNVSAGQALKVNTK